MPIGKIDQFSTYNQQEVKKQMKLLPEVSSLIQKTKQDIDSHHQEILSQITSEQLYSFIWNICMDSNGRWKTTDEITKHPSYILVTQLCLDMIWYHSTKIDADYGRGTRSAVAQFESKNNIKADGIADVEFFRQIRRLLSSVENSPTLDMWSSMIMSRDATIVSYAHPTILPSNNETLQQQNVSLWFDEILWDTNYKEIKSEFIGFADVAVLKYGLQIDEHHIKRIFQLVKKENWLFSKHHSSYTPIGQVGRLAWVDAFKKWLYIQPPVRSKTNRIDQLLATYGYMKLAGIFDAQTDSQLWASYTRYNLWLYHTRLSEAKKLSLFRGQASEMKQYAIDHMKSNNRKHLVYDDIVHAEFHYYAPDVDKILTT